MKLAPSKKQHGTADMGREEAACKVVKVVEIPVFITYTKDPTLRKQLQEEDDRLEEVTNTPASRFVER